MKSFLLAGCAAIALVGTCGTAAADGTGPGKFDVKLSGDAYFTMGYVDQQGDSANGTTRNVDFTNRFRLQVTPTAKADNGIEYGANLRVRAYERTGVLDTDQAYLFADGNFGRIEGGVNQGPNNQYGVTAPNGFGTGGVVGDWTDGVYGWLNNQNTFLEPVFGGGYDNITNSNFATKVNYFTPRFFPQDDDGTGLMGMLAFTPTNLSVNTDVNRRNYVTTTSSAIEAGGDPTQSECGGTFGNGQPLQGCAYNNIVEAGLRYDGSFGGVSVQASLGYEHGDAPTNHSTRPYTSYNDLSALQAGIQLGYAGFEIGGSYLNAGKSGYAKTSGLYLNDQSTVTAGISYQTGPVTVGFNYAHGEDAGNLYAPGSRSADLYSLGATYVLAPGLTTSLEYLRSETQNEAGYGMKGPGTDPFGNGTAYSGNANLFLWKNAIAF
jgi:hypothetical protein